MALIATEAKRLSNVVKQELWPETGYCRAVLALVKGPAIVSKAGLIVGSLVAADVYAALEAVGIACNDAV
jgi:hypothetical protein